jgi:hypothetical protein
VPITDRTPNGTSTVAYAARTNTTITKPSGAVDGVDLVLVAKTCGGSTLVEPTGFTGAVLLGRESYAAPTDPWYVDVALWAIEADVATPWTFTHVSRSTQAFAFTVTGADLSTVSDFTTSSDFQNLLISGGSANAVAPAFTTSGPDRRLVIARGSWDGAAITPPAGWTEHHDSPVLWFGSKDQPVAGTTGTVSVPAGNGDPDYPWGIIMASVRPPPATPQDEGTFNATAMAQMTGGRF